MEKGKVTVVLGGQVGSEGKGKFAGYIARKDAVDVSVCNFHPNAGHTWVGNDGERVMVQQLPQAVVNPNTVLYLSAGSAIDIDTLMREIEANNCRDRVLIHPRAMIIEERHRTEEAITMGRISSTQKGCGSAGADKVRRLPHVRLARDVEELAELIGDTTYALHNRIKGGNHVMVEVPQGFDLDINHGLEYPYCTSRQTTSTQAIADAGLAPQMVDEVIAVIRPYPIRVGNMYDENGNLTGYSGNYCDSEEITWEIVAERSGTPIEEIREMTTVTKKLRRVFEPNFDRLAEMVQVNGVTQIALNFANYIDYSILGKTEIEDITEKVWDFIFKVQEATGVPVTMVGTGARDCDIIDLRSKYGK